MWVRVSLAARRLATSVACISVLLLAAGCTESPPPVPTVVTGLDWVPNDNPRVPLAVTVSFTTDRPVRASVVLDDGERPVTLDRWPVLATEHELLLLGFHPDRDYEISVRLLDVEGIETQGPVTRWTSPPLPDTFPPLHVTVSRPERMEPGVTLLPCQRWPGRGNHDQEFTALVALDAYGEVVWFYDAPYAISEAKWSRDGHLLFYYGTLGNVVEMDMLGNVIRQWGATRFPGKVNPEGALPIDTGTIHHDVSELPDGRLLALSTELRYFESYPASETDPTVNRSPSWVVGDVIMVIEEDGTVAKRWSVLDILNPYRIGYESLDWGFWMGVYENVEEAPLRDWAHVNSVQYDEQDHALIVSSYHQDTVFKMDFETGELVWMLAFPSGWDQDWKQYLLTPVGEGLYPFHQHAARVTPQRTILMFDNGKYRALPYQPKMSAEESFSRAVEYAIDEDTMEFREVWSYGGRIGEIFFTPFLGETDWLPVKGHVLVTDGGRVRTPDGKPADHPAMGQKWARVLEVTHEMPAEVVFEVVIDDPTFGWTVYRSERLPSLYPEPVGEGAP
jgi:arylsulfate sulfotransferase